MCSESAYNKGLPYLQVGLLNQQLQVRKQRGELKKNAQGEVTDRESRLLMYQINSMMRPIQFDEDESRSLQDSQARYLLLALTNYRRLASLSALPHSALHTLPCPLCLPSASTLCPTPCLPHTLCCTQSALHIYSTFSASCILPLALCLVPTASYTCTLSQYSGTTFLCPSALHFCVLQR